jgi:RHS repeat-associated protein
VRAFNYNPSQPLELASVDLPSYYGGRRLTRAYDSFHRTVGFSLGIAGSPWRDLSQVYTYNSLGRLENIVTTPSGQSARTFTYTYNSGGLLEGYSVGSLFSVSRGYEPNRNLLTSIDSKYNGTTRTRYDYTYNTVSQRASNKQSGDAFADFGGSTYYRYGYNGKGELTDATNYLGEDASSASAQQLSGRHFAYAYDQAGNRKTASRTGTAGDPDEFGVNALNQYTSRENNYAHTAGTVANSSVTVAVSGGSAVSGVARQGCYWDAQVALNNTGQAAQSNLTFTATLAGGGSGGANLVRTGTATAFLPPLVQSMSYDADGNLSSDGVWNYAYDAENRLIRMSSTLPAGFGFTRRNLVFTYDYQGRRVSKTVTNVDTLASSTTRFLYDGWNLVAELDSTGANLSRSYTWGLDLAGSLDASGGVGALLEITDHSANTNYLATYDGNGNVASLLRDSDGAAKAIYEYSPFGELLRAEGDYASNNPFRFSTKFTDSESGLVYYGNRFYSPALGRFISCDPIGEKGGLNLYGFSGNDGINGWDYLGYSWFSKAMKSVGNWFSKNWTSVVGAVLTVICPPAGMAWNMAVGYYYGGVKGLVIGWAASSIGNAIGNTLNVNSWGGFWGGVARGAVVGGISGGISAGLSGGNIWQGISAGAIAGAVTGGIAYETAKAIRGTAIERFGQKLSNSSAFRAFRTLYQGVDKAFQSVYDDIAFAARSLAKPLNYKVEIGQVQPMEEAPDSGGYGAPGANCSLVAVQNAQKAMRVPEDSEQTIAQNMGYPKSQFEEGGSGLPSSPQKVTDSLNAALNPSGLAVDKVPQDFPFNALVAKGNPLILGTEILADGRPTLHLVTAVPTGPGNNSLIIYNLDGSGGRVTLTVSEALARGVPLNYNGQTGRAWYVFKPND